MKKAIKPLKLAVSIILVFSLVFTLFTGLNVSMFAFSTVWDGSIADSFESGTGTWNDPYTIKTAEQLAYLARSVNNGNSYSGKYISLDDDIILNDTTNWENWGKYSEQDNLIAPVNEWTPIGSRDVSFKGRFWGNNHTISGMYINGDFDLAGLFGYIEDGLVLNLEIKASVVINNKSWSSSTGSVAGEVSSYASIENCSNGGLIKGADNTGGIVGKTFKFNGTPFIYSCSNTGTVTGDGYGYTGGIVGNSYSGIYTCYNTGTVAGKSTTGGIAGRVVNSGDNSCTITDCFNTGIVTGGGRTGGVVGFFIADYGDVKDCYNAGTVTGSDDTGGVVGYMASKIVTTCYNIGTVKGSYSTGGVVGDGSATKCYNTGAVSGESSVGGVVGDGSATECYNTGAVSGESSVGGVIGNNEELVDCYNSGLVTGKYSDIGGLVGRVYDGSIVENGYYLSGCVEAGNSFGTALTDEQMQNKNSFVGWNFNKTWEIGFDNECSYPTLRYYGSKEYYYRIQLLDGEKCLLDELVKVGDSITLPVLDSRETLDFVYWRDLEGWSYTGEYYPYEDMKLKATWLTHNTSPDVWDGSVDTDWTGSGTQEDPYLISSAAELAGLSQQVNNGTNYYGQYFRQTADLVLNDGGERFCEEIVGQNRWMSIGDYRSFNGKYDGDGHTISGLFQICHYSNYAGLFGNISSGSVSNLEIKDSYVSNYNYNNTSYTGGIVGYVNHGYVTNCRYNGAVAVNSNYTGNPFGAGIKYAVAGGVVGSTIWYDTTTGIVDCHNSGTVKGIGSNIIIGGVVGLVDYSCVITNCSNTGDVAGSGINVGGVVGNGSVENCFNSGTVTGDGDDTITGGITGDLDDSTMTNCYNTGTVTGKGRFTGGLSGRVSLGAEMNNCYNRGTVKGINYTGGITGELYDSTMTNCYNVGKVTGDSSKTGGITGINYLGMITNSYYLSGCVANGNSYGTALTGEQMQNQNSFVGWNFNKTWELGFDSSFPYPTLKCFGSKEYYYNVRFFDDEWLMESIYVKVGDSFTFSSPTKSGLDFSHWRINETKYFAGETFFPIDDIDFNAIWSTRNTSRNVWDGSVDTNWEGNGTAESPYLISTAAELAGLADQANNQLLEERQHLYFRQTADIVLNDGGEQFCNNIIGKNEWMPISNGQYWNIAAVHYDGNGHTVSGIYIRNSYDYAGLFGYGELYISNLGVERSYIFNTSGAITGGVAGSAIDIINCYNSGTVIGQGKYSTATGGVAGQSFGSVINCYNTGTVIYTGEYDSSTGGVIGRGGTAINCYNTGTVKTTGNNSERTGGVLGAIASRNDVEINNCYNTGKVIMEGQFAKNSGGVIGDLTNCFDHTVAISVSNCYNTGTVKTTGKNSENIGGIIGNIKRDYNRVADIYVAGCYNTGSVINLGQSANKTGGVIGDIADSYGDATIHISLCYNTGTVLSPGEHAEHTGGVVGNADNSTVSNCYNTGDVTGNSFTGGVIGSADNSTVSNCYNTCAVTGNDYSTGGVVGSAYNSTVSDCYNTGAVIDDSETGGIVGAAGNSTVSNCYNTGAVIGDSETGGIVGAAGNSTVSNCYNTGAVTGNDYYTGGVVGSAYNSTVSDCYNIGAVIGDSYTGGVVGDKYDSTIDNCYYLSDCAANGNNYGTALTDVQMKTAEAFAGFDFDEYWEIGVVEGYDYPTLQNVEHIITYTVTFLDKDGTILKAQTVEKGQSAYPPYVEGYSDENYYYTLDHWDGNYTNVTKDQTVTAVYKQVEIIRFNDIAVPFIVEYGFSNEELRVHLESYFNKKLCTTTNGYKMMCEIVWNEDDLSAYNSKQAGEYLINGVLKISDSSYSQFADYYDMADGASVKVKVTVLPKDEQAVHFEKNDLQYEVMADGKNVTITGYSGNAAEVIIPETIDGYNVVAIGENAFADNQTITAVTIPSSVKLVGNHSFTGCSALVQVTFEDGVEEIGENAFYNTDLVRVTLPDSVETIGAKAFGYYGDNNLIDGFAIYCNADSAAEQYADENGIYCGLLQEKTDEETGISILAEENVTLVVAQVEEGSYYDNAQQIVQENDNISLFEIKVVDDKSNEVQPGNTLRISVPVPEGFNAEKCEVYRINTDGTYKAMNAKIIDGKLVFMTPHLSYYAIVEGPIEKYLAGDIDCDEIITDSDATYLLFHLFFPDEYPINQPCDFNRDDKIDTKDVLYLLYYVYFPKLYPIA